MKMTLIVVDDFYEDPDSIWERAVNLDFERENAVNYPGRTAPTFQDVAPTMKRFADLVGEAEIRYRGKQGAFRITTERDMASRSSLIHLDSSDYSAVIYLSKAPTEGTYFYRHKALALERVSLENSHRPDIKKAIETDTLNLDAWELTQMIQARYNRLLIFDGKYFHSGARRLAGQELREGRLTQNFFFFKA